jgi:hypothetical protein
MDLGYSIRVCCLGPRVRGLEFGVQGSVFRI